MPPGADLGALPAEVRRGVLAAADELLCGRAELLGAVRHDMLDPTWATDPVSGLSYPDDQSAFRIDYRSPSDSRNVKNVWELSRHQHLTVLACAWRLTGDDRYADLAASHLRSWWAKNPILSGVNWSSGIELGIRLISWAWTRRLLDGWAGAPSLFEDNETAAHHIYWHQRYLAVFRSRGSSANNHVIAEAAGQLVASCAFPWFEESERWRTNGAALLESELERNTFPDGNNRELAFEYHGLVAELGLVAAAEAEAAGAPLSSSTWRLLCRMVDVTAAVLDRSGQPPRFGDGDDGRGLVVDAPDASRWRSLLAVGAALFGPLPWWPPIVADAQSVLVASLVGRAVDGGQRPADRPSFFPDAGLTILRSSPDALDEIWCRCDGGPHGYLSIAAHAHADALSVELRHNGVELLADPGTYCYHGDPVWRRYFRSTLAHNTIEIDGLDQSVPGGPFLWTRQARTHMLDVAVDGVAPLRWSAEHDGYVRLRCPTRHRRTVTLDPADRSVAILDELTSDDAHAVRLVFHLGPAIRASLDEHEARLRWDDPRSGPSSAVVVLPQQLEWRAHRGDADTPLGWYSKGFGRKEPSTTLVGTGRAATTLLRTDLRLSATAQPTLPAREAPL
jgi:hypothetical protein